MMRQETDTTWGVCYGCGGTRTLVAGRCETCIDATNSIRVQIQPVGNAIVECAMSGDIPVITWRGEGIHGRVEVLLGNVDDASDYLRRLGRQLTAFAAQVDAARDTRQPTGYDAPKVVGA